MLHRLPSGTWASASGDGGQGACPFNSRWTPGGCRKPPSPVTTWPQSLIGCASKVLCVLAILTRLVMDAFVPFPPAV